ncbi:uncharacterized protein LOC143247304 isoform X2 [Tachypleus tridentatus]|uniref:uncharacterized protein LOC143247304 isoform X2 n=1 Tax=Tachypleus tridentatus TaxID=6853 RepID=UPI003FD55AA2
MDYSSLSFRPGLLSEVCWNLDIEPRNSIGSLVHEQNHDLKEKETKVFLGEYGENLVIRFVPPKIKAHRSISRRRFCPNCQQYYCKERLPLHKCKERLYCCPVCHKRLSNEHSLKRHIRLQHSVIPREAYKCKVCGKEFLTLSYAEEHKEKCRSFEVLDS